MFTVVYFCYKYNLYLPNLYFVIAIDLLSLLHTTVTL